MENIQSLVNGLKSGDRNALGKCITMIESVRPDHMEMAEEILDACRNESGNSIRIGITGVPGVGKSTFIESFGKYLIQEHKKKVAVLAVDPSSTKSKGSILGDKTRMSELAANESAFIRPSPSSGSLGGVGTATREIIMLCEAAGYDVIIVETVGVGQSETEVKELVDFFMLLMLPGAGDELQGIKRGIIELADAIFINKADGDNIKKANQAKAAYISALHLFPPSESGWEAVVETCSALESANLDLAWNTIRDFTNTTKSSGFFEQNRKNQIIDWFDHILQRYILFQYESTDSFLKSKEEYLNRVSRGEMNARKAARAVLQSFKD